MHGDDQQLIADFLNGDANAVAQIRQWLGQAGRRFRVSLRMPWEDVEQELLLEVTSLLRTGSFRGDSRLRTYLWRVTQCTCLNLLRDQKRSREVSAEDDNLPEPRARGPSVLRRIEEAQAVTRLHHLMHQMPADCRRLWTLILAGKSYREMSDELGIATGTLRVRVLRCRRRALAWWQTHHGEPKQPAHDEGSPERRQAVK